MDLDLIKIAVALQKFSDRLRRDVSTTRHGDVWMPEAKVRFNAYRQRLKELRNGIALAEGIVDLAESESSTATAEIEEAEEGLELDTRCEWCSYLNLCGARG